MTTRTKANIDTAIETLAIRIKTSIDICNVENAEVYLKLMDRLVDTYETLIECDER